MNHKCLSCGNEVPPSRAELHLERLYVSMGKKVLHLQALLNLRTQQLRNAYAHRRAMPPVAAKRGPAAPTNRKGTPGYTRWLRKFRLKNTPRLRRLQSARHASA